MAVESVHVHGPIPSEMRAVVLGGVGWGHLAVRRVRVPRPGSYQLLARVDCASICTSLLKLIEQGSEHPLMYSQNLERFPATLGDEWALTLVEVGEALRSTYFPGERFVLQPSINCRPLCNLDRYSCDGEGIEKDLRKTVTKLTGGHGADDVIVAVGSQTAVSEAQAIVGRSGVLNLFGGLPGGRGTVSFDGTAVHYLEMNVTGSSGGYAWDMKKVLEMTAARQIEPSVHITHVGDLEDVPDFLQLVRNREIDGKAIVYPHRRTQKAVSVAEWTSSDERPYLGVAE